MNDCYAEWLVKRKTPAYAIPLKILMVIICVLSVLFAMVSAVGMIVMVVALVGAYFLFPYLSLEFEYLVVNDQLTIDKVMGKSKRKRAWEGNMNEAQIIAPVDSYMVKDYEKQGMKVLDFSSHQPGAKVYAIIHQNGSEAVKVLFEPNDKILSCLRQKAPRKVVL